MLLKNEKHKLSTLNETSWQFYYKTPKLKEN